MALGPVGFYAASTAARRVFVILRSIGSRKRKMRFFSSCGVIRNRIAIVHRHRIAKKNEIRSQQIMHAEPWTDSQFQRAVQMATAGESYARIGAAIGKTKDAVKGYLSRRNIATVVPVGRRPTPTSRRQEILALRRNGKTYQQIAESLNTTVHRVDHTLRSAGVVERDPLPVGHPLTWGILTAGTVLDGAECRR